MEEILFQSQLANREKEANMVVDIESLEHPPDKCSGSPTVTKALSRKGSSRMERWGGEEQDDELSRKLVVKVLCSHLDQLKQPLAPNKVLSGLAGASTSSSNPCLTDALEGRYKRFNRLTIINPRKIVLLFATMSSMGTMVLIYFTLAINWRNGAGQ